MEQDGDQDKANQADFGDILDELVNADRRHPDDVSGSEARYSPGGGAMRRSQMGAAEGAPESEESNLKLAEKMQQRFGSECSNVAAVVELPTPEITSITQITGT